TDDLQAERRNVELTLAFMARREQREQALQSHLIVPTSRGERTPLDHALPTRPIPVVTDFVCPIRGPLPFTDTCAAPRAARRRPGGQLLSSAQSPLLTALHREVAWKIAIRSESPNGVTCRSNDVWTGSSSRGISRGWPTERSKRWRP